MPQVIVDRNLCTGCGVCARVCPVQVFDMHDRLAVPTRVATCMGCELCVTECRWRAIGVERLAPASNGVHPPVAAPVYAAQTTAGAGSFGLEAPPSVQPLSVPVAQAPLAPAAPVPTFAGGQQQSAPLYSTYERALVPAQQQVPQQSSSPSPFLSAPDFFPYFVVKKGPPESQGG